MLNQSKNRNLSIKEIPVCARQKVARLISPQTRQGRVEPDSFVARVWKQTTPPLHGLIFPFQGFPPGLQSWQCSYSTCSVSGAIIHKIWPSKPRLMSGKSQANVCPLVSIYGQILCFHGNSPRYRTYQAIINGPGVRRIYAKYHRGMNRMNVEDAKKAATGVKRKTKHTNSSKRCLFVWLGSFTVTK